MNKINSKLEKLLFSAQVKKTKGFTEHKPLSKSEAPFQSTVKPTENSTFNSRDQPLEKKQVKETGGPKGLEPTRYGDWERDGRCVDF
jgi:hypothetical protein|tara:strand:- start:12448 stop:12708 length:261 start_codon:yes stop_codon:yes gene_type:complete